MSVYHYNMHLQAAYEIKGAIFSWLYVQVQSDIPMKHVPWPIFFFLPSVFFSFINIPISDLNKCI